MRDMRARGWEAAHMVRRLTIWIASLTVAMLMMAIVLAGAAHV